MTTGQQASVTLAVVDTSVYMHFRRFDEVDWCDVVGAELTVLVLSVDILRELDKHKDQHPRRPMRERARGVVKRLKELVPRTGAGIVRDGVQIIFYHPRLTAARFEELGLNPDIPDERVLAAASTLRSERPNDRVVIVARDSGAQMLAAHIGLDVVEMPDALKLEEEADPQERELRQLRDEHIRLLRARPQLMLTFLGGQTRHTHTFYPPARVSAEELERLARAEAARYPLYAQTPASERGFNKPDHDLVELYDEERKRYLVNYWTYLDAQQQWAHRTARRVALAFTLENTGGAPAMDASVSLLFPIGHNVERQDEPIEPAPPPPRPGTMAEVVARSRFRDDGSFYSGMGREPNRVRLTNPGYQLAIDEDTRTDGVAVTYTRKKLQQQDSADLVPLFVILPADAIRSFTLPYELRADNVDPVRGSLHVIVATAGDPPPGLSLS